MRAAPFGATVIASVCLASSLTTGTSASASLEAAAQSQQFDVPLPPDTRVEWLASDVDGRVLHAGNTFSDAFPVTLGALQSRCDRSRYGYCLQGLVMVFSPAGGLQYSTFAGGECHRAQVCASARPGPSAPVAWATTD